MALQCSVTDPTTGAVYPEAYVRIDDAQVQLANSSVILTLNTYYNAAAAAEGMLPVMPAFQVTLSQDEIADLRTLFRSYLYVIPEVRAQFPNALDV